MKAKELRIGNYLRSAAHNSIVMVQAIASDNKIDIEDLTVNVIYNRLDLEKENLILPINLTEEWFNKMGLYLGDDDFGLKLAKDDTDPDKYLLAIDRFVISRFKYVHQLQNLYFSITGEELVLKGAV